MTDNRLIDRKLIVRLTALGVLVGSLLTGVAMFVAFRRVDAPAPSRKVDAVVESTTTTEAPTSSTTTSTVAAEPTAPEAPVVETPAPPQPPSLDQRVGNLEQRVDRLETTTSTSTTTTQPTPTTCGCFVQ